MLREKLRSGDVYVKNSRRYLQLERYLIPKVSWAGERKDATGLLGAPLTAGPRLAERTETCKRLAIKVNNILMADQGAVRREADRLAVSPIEAEENPPSLMLLRKLIDERLPRVDITELLIEVNNLTGFSNSFQHLDGVATRSKSLLTQLYACVLAQACNLGFKQMAASASLPYRSLLWCNRWYLRDGTLDEAITKLVNYHHAVPLSSLWGGGVLSSSDGQRFPVSSDTRRARALPRYFGYGKGVTNYSWTSDQLSQFGSKTIPSTLRDATYTLDEILDNETDLDLAEHTTDTAGYTELIFGLFGLLGLIFSPRIRDLADQQLYYPGSADVQGLTALRPYLSRGGDYERSGRDVTRGPVTQKRLLHRLAAGQQVTGLPEAASHDESSSGIRTSGKDDPHSALVRRPRYKAESEQAVEQGRGAARVKADHRIRRVRRDT